MTAKADPIEKARELPSGAKFYKCALQVNPHHYGETFRGQPSDGDASSHARAIIDKAVELGIKVLAVTDHNNVSGVAAFRDAAQGRSVYIFPGFELSSSEGVHILCLYPLDVSDSQLGRYLGEFGIRDTSPSSDLANKPFVKVLEVVQSQGGITIAAHATNNRGLFKVLNGKARIRAWQDTKLLAIQIPGTICDLPQDIHQIVENRNVDYRRPRLIENACAVAAVNAKDIAKPEDLNDRSATCWIKMSEVSIEGLRQAFLDPGSRIRLNPKNGKLEPEEHTELVALAWEGGFLDGVTVHLNSNLNVLIGGRGTGKSTFVESIRAVLGLEPIGEDARKAHDGIIRYVLRGGTKIIMLVRVYRPGVHEYRIERTIPNPPLVREMSGKVTNLAPTDIIPKVEAYGQHEISELTKSSEKLTRLLDRFVKRDESLTSRKASLRRELQKNRRALCDTHVAIETIEEDLAALPGLEETLNRFQEVGLEERLREQSLLVREERVLGSVPERLGPFRDALETMQRELPIDRAFLSERALKDLPGKKVLSRANQVLADLEKDIERVSDELEKALNRADLRIGQVSSDWESRRQHVKDAYQQILRDLQKSRVDGEEFIRLRRKIEELLPLQERRTLLDRLLKEHTDKRRELVAEWEDIKAKEFRILDQAAKEVSRKLRNHVKVRVTAGTNRRSLFEMLRTEISGRMSETIDRLDLVSDLSLTQLVEACRLGAEELKRVYGIPSGQAERICRADPEIYMRIEELELAPATAISLNTAPKGDPPAWQKLEKLSTGQKATAVLLLLLLESDAPLIVDQPEDDLDNRFITEGIVPRMREEKQRRQFIFSTHNANIPVLGDAEMILGLSASGEAGGGSARIALEHMGSIDFQSVRELVEEILEGGRDAFETRRRKYGF